MRRFLSFGLPVLASLCVLSSTAQAGPFDFLKRGAAGPRLVAQADPPLPAPGVSRGAGPTIQPVGDEQPPVPIPDERSAPPAAAPIELYPCVTYEDRDEMHPCAVPVVVGVPDPSSVKHPFYWLVGDAPRDTCHGCANGCDPCGGCGKPLAFVEICVPPGCSVPEPRVLCNQRKYVYDFGEYRVEVRLKRGEIEVDYED